ncbi:TPA: recombinase family protein [Enterobacter hormaechei subsp. xiangfangensis]|nr:recombinase family protein [Enterobacter hormaechei subsp. xiangfangensis]HAV1860658.1 recombinase family protein [Enterobacter hormaechei subsp. xiangfangensis]
MSVYYYCRVSTKDQTTDNQVMQIKARYAAPDAIYSDDGVSGTKAPLERPQFKAMVSVLKPGDTVTTVAIDRLGRNVDDVRSTAQLFVDMGCSLISMREGCDFSTPTGKMVITVLAAVAELERSNIVERVNAGLARTVAQGTVLGRKPSEKKEEAMSMIAEGQTIETVMNATGISSATYQRYKREYVNSQA